MIVYLCIGLLFYSIVAAINWRVFKGRSFISIVRGFLIGVFLWPIVMPALLHRLYCRTKSTRNPETNINQENK